MKKYIAEFIGTFGLTAAVMGSIAMQGSLPTVLIAGITLGLFVATIGHISGAHINPAVTIGVWSLKKISATDALLYIIAQFAGAALAILVGKFGGLATSASQIAFAWPAFVAELIGTILFTFGIASVILAKHHEGKGSGHAPFIIGGSLTLGTSIALGFGSNAVLNPAVAFGIGSFGLAYIIAPVIGSLAGMWIYKLLND